MTLTPVTVWYSTGLNVLKRRVMMPASLTPDKRIERAKGLVRQHFHPVRVTFIDAWTLLDRGEC